jgi:integrase
MGENRKEHSTPLSDECVALLRREQARIRAIGGAWVFPSAQDASKCLSPNAVGSRFKRLAAQIGLPSGERYRWHAA